MTSHIEAPPKSIDTQELSEGLKYLIENAEWIFSGIGTTILASIGGLIFTVIMAWLSYWYKGKASASAQEAEIITQKIKHASKVVKGNVLSSHLVNALDQLKGMKKSTRSTFIKIIDQTSDFLSNYQNQNDVYVLVSDAQKYARDCITIISGPTPDDVEIEDLKHGIRVALQEALSAIRNEDS
ncbi:hypothetical protein [Terasakiella pusilla]|uniref:hypothetical protein n=1 Tax=Terasakiella pusilla TaxID=64973 RepID=UPI003AA99ED6